MKKIAVIFASQRKNGKYQEIKNLIESQCSQHMEFITLYDKSIQPCSHCLRCHVANRCIKHKDDFDDIMRILCDANILIFVCPLYTIVPSRLTAIFERISNVEYFAGNSPPFRGKTLGVIGYGSSGISYQLMDLIKETITPFSTGFNSNQEIDFICNEGQKAKTYSEVLQMTESIITEVNKICEKEI